MQLSRLTSALRRGLQHLTLPRTSLNDQLRGEPYRIDGGASCIRFDVSALDRGLYYLSLEYDSDCILAGPRLTAARPAFETPDHIFTFVRRDQREFFGTVLIVDDIEAIVFYPSRLPCEVSIRSVSLRRINTFAREYIYGEQYVRLKLFGASWTWDRIREDSARALSRWLRGGTDDSYATWWKLYGEPDAATLQAQRTELESWSAGEKPLFSIVLPVYQSRLEYLRQAVDSVRGQSYPGWELCICDDGSGDAALGRYLDGLCEQEPRIKLVVHPHNRHISAASNSALALATGEFVAFLDHDDALSPDALFRVAEALRRQPQTDILYSDEDVVDPDGKPLAPHFKPDWNFDLLRSINYACHFLVVRRALLSAVGGLREGFEGAQDFDLVLRLTENLPAARIAHLPRVLYHWRAVEGSTASDSAAKPYAEQAGLRALADHVARCGLPATALPSEIPTAYRLRFDLPDPVPTVSIIIPTHNQLRLLRHCIDSLLARTDYPAYEVVVVDNRSDDADTLAYLATLPGRGLRVLRYDKPFNFSAINNFAVAQCDSDMLVLLNNDTEVCNGDWLREMIAQASRPGIGAVGAKLFYAEDRIQHAGVLLGVGLDRVAAHAFKGAHKDEVGMLARTRLLQAYHAVTGACLAVARDKYLEVGGLDEEHLTVAFNDVDFCLRLEEKGYTNLWTPYAQLYHFESYSRGYDNSGEKRERFVRERDYLKARWPGSFDRDNYYNPNLSLDFDNFSLAWPPREG
ncbi:glycosyltransferase family 2 protein [Haliea sp. E17]|uniref:glycosyltransferase family 2 protein n=1 Tax=Haliea sp. E17 TaxID=3401576 RepID=UPI003AAADDE5